jgi:hypothetical protein
LHIDSHNEYKRKLVKSEVADLAHELQQVPRKSLSAWDHAALAKVKAIQQATEQDEYVSALKRVFELAGLNYEIEKKSFWRRYNAHLQRRSSKD